MPLRYLSLEKYVSFQGREEAWSNVYLYNMADGTQTYYQSVVTAVLNAERAVHGSNVNFRTARIYTTQGLNGSGDAGNMYFTTTYSATPGTGGDPSGTFYYECAILCKWTLPRKILGGGQLGRHRALKKWIHPCVPQSRSVGENSGLTALTTANKSIWTTYMTAVELPITGVYLTAPDGTEASTDATKVVHPYVEHRQFPRGRKEYAA